MTIIIGKIESLERLKSELYSNGIHRFKSVRDVQAFMKNYELEKKEAIKLIESSLDEEIKNLEQHAFKSKEEYTNKVSDEILYLKSQIAHLNSRSTHIASIDNKIFRALFNPMCQRSLKWKMNNLEKNLDKIVAKKTAWLSQRAYKACKELNEYKTNRDRIISVRTTSQLDNLARIKKITNSLQSLVAGAIGENKVVNELKKLPDNNILINDFSIVLDNPIYNRNEKNTIHSIQIDHLLINNSGIYIIETKNWSQTSIETLSLRSPVKQILRTNYALFKIINRKHTNQKVILSRHHWGEIQVPIKSVIVMINNKPRESFKFVQVKSLDELNDYVSFFDPIINDSEVNNIRKFLESLMVTNSPATSVYKKAANNSLIKNRIPSVPSKPSLKAWLQNNPGMGINDYYSIFGTKLIN